MAEMGKCETCSGSRQPTREVSLDAQYHPTLGSNLAAHLLFVGRIQLQQHRALFGDYCFYGITHYCLPISDIGSFSRTSRLTIFA